MAERGQDYILQASAAGTEFTTIGRLTNVSLSREKETIETNNFDSPNDAESIAGMKSWSLSAEALYFYTNAGQILIEAAFASTAPYHFRLTSAAGTVGAFQFTGQGHVTSLELDFETNEVVPYSFEIEGTGILTRAAIAGS
jgi:predicted secreted protein